LGDGARDRVRDVGIIHIGFRVGAANAEILDLEAALAQVFADDVFEPESGVITSDRHPLHQRWTSRCGAAAAGPPASRPGACGSTAARIVRRISAVDVAPAS